jgi:hypothetical protein
MYEITQNELIIEYFKKNPNRDIKHPEIVDWLVKNYKERTGKVFRDPDRGIRKLAQSGYLIKIKKGVYRYEPGKEKNVKLYDFTPRQKTLILKDAENKCAQCGMGKKEGVELHIDHIIPKDFGGKATVENGQVLCSRCNFLKKNLKQTQSGKKMFIRMYKMAKKEGNIEVLKFCEDLLRIYEEYNVNGHIEWKS